MISGLLVAAVLLLPHGTIVVWITLFHLEYVKITVVITASLPLAATALLSCGTVVVWVKTFLQSNYQ